MGAKLNAKGIKVLNLFLDIRMINCDLFMLVLI